MASWDEFSADAPALAAAVRARFEATKHHVLATLRADGSPRVSGTEVQFHGPDLTMGMMPGSAKGRDLQHDPRLALHSNPGDSTMAGGDAKLAGLAVEVTDDAELRAFAGDVQTPPGPFHLFRIDLTGVVLTSLHPEGDRLVIETWHPGEGVARTERT